jgi:transposase-like protein
MQCPVCGSFEVVKAGKTGAGAQRYKCHNCAAVKVIKDERVVERLSRVEAELAEVKRLNAEFQAAMEDLKKHLVLA